MDQHAGAAAPETGEPAVGTGAAAAGAGQEQADGPAAAAGQAADGAGATPEPAEEDASRRSPEGAAEPAADPAILALEAEVAQVRQQLLRTMADFDNFRRRTRQEKEELEQFATRKLLLELLPVVDNLERALAAPTAAEDPMRTGVEMVYRQLLGVLERFGAVPMAAAGQRFDPALHEAVLQAPAEQGEVGVVLEELQKGYWLHGKVLRPALVKVSV
ncbi:MAG: nucleotide exchange factor GrpE [Alicyclobacillus sp.]|nr:nucleotide exchange factor GrpE [Alicyclobacillus sp.]